MHEKRKTVYHWRSRQALEKYFEACYGLTKDQVAAEIKVVKEEFVLRRHKALDIRDLWQKTGLHIIKMHPLMTACYCTCNDKCEHLDDAGVCSWSSACPWRRDIIVE